MSSSIPPVPPSIHPSSQVAQDEKIRELEKKIIAQGQLSKKIFERKIKIRGLEDEMRMIKAELEEKIHVLEETVTVQHRRIYELEEKMKLEFVAAQMPPKVTMDPTWQAKIEQDFKEAQVTALPEDDEDL